jgi:hypothetical protein
LDFKRKSKNGRSIPLVKSNRFFGQTINSVLPICQMRNNLIAAAAKYKDNSYDYYPSAVIIKKIA